MATVRDLSGNNPTDLKYSPHNRTAADLTAILALTPQYVGEIVKALNTGRNYRALNATTWGLIGPVTSVIAGTLPAPSVTINQAAGQADPVTTGPLLFTVNFSQDVTGFTTGDVSFTGSTAGTGGTAAGLVGTVTGGPNVYTVTVTGMAVSGNVIAIIPAGVATGPGGANNASTSVDNVVAFVIDTTPPTMSIDKAVGQPDPASGSSILFTAVASEVISGFTSGDVSFTGSTAGAGGTPSGLVAAISTSDGVTHTITVTGMAVNGNVVVNVPIGAFQDVAGNANTVAASVIDNTVAWTAPAVGGLNAPLPVMGLLLN